MTSRCRFFISVTILSLVMTFAASAEPKATAPKTENQVVTRGELVNELEKILIRCEDDSAKYASRNDMQALRQMLRGLRLELDSLGTRTSISEEQSGTIQQRVDHTARPGF